MPQIDLDGISVASPCTADWDAMEGGDSKRFCSQCELNVYNLSAMGRDEAQAFVRESEGDVCVRMYKRTDGTLITQDCPVGLRAMLRRRLSWLAGLAASLLATVAGVFMGVRGTEDTRAAGPRPLPLVVMGGPGFADDEPACVDLPADSVEPDDLRPLMGEMVVREPEPEPEVCDEPEMVMGQMRVEPAPEPEPEPQPEELTPQPDEPRKIMGKMLRVR